MEYPPPNATHGSLSIYYIQYIGKLVMQVVGSGEIGHEIHVRKWVCLKFSVSFWRNNSSVFLHRAVEDANNFCCSYGMNYILQIDLSKLENYCDPIENVIIEYLTIKTHPRVELVTGSRAWTKRELASLALYCTILPGNECDHTEVYYQEEHFYASTGSGSTVTITYCKYCHKELAKHSVYND